MSWVRGTKNRGAPNSVFIWGVYVYVWHGVPKWGSRELFFFCFCKRIRSKELKISALIFKRLMNLKFEPDLGCRAEHSLYFWQISLVGFKIYYCWLTLGSKELNHDATLDLKNRYHLFRRVPPPQKKTWTDPGGQIAKSDQGTHYNYTEL